MDKNIDIMFVVETWFRNDDPVVISESTPPCYTFLNSSRDGNDCHGGVAIISRSSLNLSFTNTVSAHATFKLACVADPKRHATFAVRYRPPPSAKNGLKTSDFLNDFDDLLGEVTLLSSKIILLGDFNIHVDTPGKSDVSHFLTSLSDCGLHQYIIGPTHKQGHSGPHHLSSRRRPYPSQRSLKHFEFRPFCHKLHNQLYHAHSNKGYFNLEKLSKYR